MSISAHTFQFRRQNGWTSTFTAHGREYHLNTASGDCWRSGAWKTVTLPRKFKGALIVAALIYIADSPGIRPKWKPRWPA